MGLVGALTEPYPGAQLGDHLHHVGHGHLAGAHGLEALGQRSVGVLLDVELRLDGHGPPAAGGVDGHLLELGAAAGGREEVTTVTTRGYQEGDGYRGYHQRLPPGLN